MSTRTNMKEVVGEHSDQEVYNVPNVNVDGEYSDREVYSVPSIRNDRSVEDSKC